jgi:RNA polymerase sigma factor (sigma-70 family)
MDVVTRLLERADQFEDDMNIESYAIRSVKNRFIDNRRYQIRMVTESSMSSDEANFFDGIADERAELATTSTLERRDLARALSATGTDCLEILTLFGVGSSYKEIAEHLDKAIGTVMSRMARCRTKLRLQLEEPA